MAEAGEVSINAVYKTELYAVTGQFSLWYIVKFIALPE